MGNLDARVVLISGAGSGIGAATAVRAVAAGAQVVLGDIQTEQVRSVASAVGEAAASHQLDVTSPDSWTAFVEFGLETFGRIDGLVNNAGIATSKGIHETSAEDMLKVFTVNAIGPVLGIQAALGALERSTHGSVVNVASGGAMIGLRHNIAYATSKYGVRGLSKALVHELGAVGVRVNCVFPGHVNTPLSRPDLTWNRTTDTVIDPAPSIALGRTGFAEEIAGAIVFLLSSDSSYCTGTELLVDGGLLSVLPERD